LEVESSGLSVTPVAIGGEHFGRLVIPTCVGCGSMGITGTCEQGCREERLDVVGADSFDRVVADTERSRAAASALRAVAAEMAAEESAAEGMTAKGTAADGMAASDSAAEGAEDRYRRLQAAALAALRAHPRSTFEVEEPRAETVWYCRRCGGIDAPQPCLGICVWERVEWVDVESWQRACERRDAAVAVEASLRRLLHLAAFVTPRDGRWEAGAGFLRDGARKVLRDGPPAA